MHPMGQNKWEKAATNALAEAEKIKGNTAVEVEANYWARAHAYAAMYQAERTSELAAAIDLMHRTHSNISEILETRG